MSRNSRNGKSGDGVGTGTEPETEPGLALLGSGTFLSAYILPDCCCCTGGGLYYLRSPFSSKKSASVWGTASAKFILPGPVEED